VLVADIFRLNPHYSLIVLKEPLDPNSKYVNCTASFYLTMLFSAQLVLWTPNTLSKYRQIRKVVLSFPCEQSRTRPMTAFLSLTVEMRSCNRRLKNWWRFAAILFFCLNSIFNKCGSGIRRDLCGYLLDHWPWRTMKNCVTFYGRLYNSVCFRKFSHSCWTVFNGSLKDQNLLWDWCGFNGTFTTA